MRSYTLKEFLEKYEMHNGMARDKETCRLYEVEFDCNRAIITKSLLFSQD